MKFTSIRVVGPTSIELPKQNLDPLNPFLLKNADGIGPTQMNVIIKNSRIGGVRKGRQPDLRVITLTVGLNPDWNIGQTPDDLRDILYSFMGTDDEDIVTVQFMDGDTVVAQAIGQIDLMEPVLFTKDPQVLITIPCLDANLIAPLESVQDPEKVNTGTSSAYFDVENEGNAASGFWMGFLFTGTHSGSIQLQDDSSPPKFMSISTGTNWVAGDRLIIDTRPGSRCIWKIPNGSSTQQNIMNALSPNSPWMTVQRGTNRFIINSRVWDWYFFGVVHRPAYLGV